MPNDWDRLPHETPKQFAAFATFRDLGPERSIAAAHLKHTGKLAKNNRAQRHWHVWSAQNRWVDRAQKYDQHLESIKALYEEKAHAEAITSLAKMREVHKRNETAMSNLMMRRVKEILEWPLTKEKTLVAQSPDGKQITYIIKRPSRWSQNTAAILAVAASKIGRAGLDMKEDESEIAPDDFKKNFFRSDRDAAAAMPPGAVPPMPADPSAPPVLALQQREGDDGNVIKVKVRPVNGNGNGEH